MGPHVDGGGQHGLAEAVERSGAGNHRRARLEDLSQARGVVQRDGARLSVVADLLGEDLELGGIAAGQHHPRPTAAQVGRDEAAGEARRAVDGDRAGLLGGRRHRPGCYLGSASAPLGCSASGRR